MISAALFMGGMGCPSIDSTSRSATATSSAGNWPRAAAVVIDATRCQVSLARYSAGKQTKLEP